MAYLLVTNDIEPYYRDIPALMALPPGFRFRFRYERSPELDLAGDARAKDMIGEDGAIIFRHRSTSEFVPIRRMQIHHVFDSVYLTVLEFTVLNFPDPALRGSWNLLGDAIEREASKNVPGGVLCPLIFRIKESALDSAIGRPHENDDHQENFERWRAVIDSIAHFDLMAKVCFLCAHGLQEDQTVLPWSRVCDGALQVRPETAYGIEFVSTFLQTNQATDEKDAVPEFRLTLKTDSTLAVAIQASSSVVSRYDNHRLSFRARAGIEGIGTSVVISPVDVPPGVFVPPISLPIQGQIAEWQWFSLVVGTLLYATSFAMPDSLQKIFQALAIILIAVLGRDSAAALMKFVWRMTPLNKLRNSFRGTNK
jgi:hypothetical protein